MFQKLVLIYLCLICLHAKAQKKNQLQSKNAIVSKLDDGIVVQFKNTTTNTAKLVKLQVITGNIIRVVASPVDSFSSVKSLMALEVKRSAVNWHMLQKPGSVTISTLQLNATVSTINGAVYFTDKKGKTILAEKADGGKTFLPVMIDGEALYQLKQVFQSPQNEALYGLGQHQNGVMNYKNQPVDLTQNNTEVAVPFLVSDKNYGILWDNYSITKVSDSRNFEPLNGLKLFAADGTQGWLTATYLNKKSNAVFAQRAESIIDYEYLHNLKSLPDSFKMADGKVKWEGAIQSAVTGKHKFFFKFAGYAKIWIDGKLLADRWRQSWNPSTAILDVDLEANKKYSFKIEWNPDGGESYIGCKFLPPLQGEEANEYSFKSEVGHQSDYYFVYGNTLDEVIGGYRKITGPAVMMPKWAMGLWQSRERYKTQDEILQTVEEFRKRKIPLDNIVLDWSYWEQDKWGSQQFDATRFADAEGMIKTLHDKYNTHFMISVWPKFYEGIQNYKDLDAQGFLYKRNIVNKQRDWIGKGYVSTFYDAFNPKARAAFWGMMNKNLFSKGIDAWWLDATEPDILSNVSVEHRKQLMSPNLGSSTQYFNGFPLMNAKGVYEGQRSVKPNQRVFILTRSAYGGLQNYAAATWSGDIAARWEDFKNQIPAGLNFSMSGLPYWTTDIGGFAVERRYEKAKGQDVEEWRELSTRWYQYGAFCPLFRVHGQFPYREIYNIAPEGSPAYESMLYYDKLRYRLMPYIYSLAGKTYHENYTIMRGLAMDFATDGKVKNIADQFMFGPSILVNPVTDFKATTKSLYLPATTGWYDFYTNKYYQGGQQITADAPLQKIPLFVKEGAIIPFGPELQYTSEKQSDTITLRVYTGKDGAFSLYEDEGINYNYEKGKYATMPFSYNNTSKTVTIGDRKGEFETMLKERFFRIIWVEKDKPKPFDINDSTGKLIKYSGKSVTVHLQ